MPYVRIQLKSGRSGEKKEELAKKIIDIMSEMEFADRERIRVIFEDMKAHDLYSGEDY